MQQTRDESRQAVRRLAEHGQRYYADQLGRIYDLLAEGRYFPSAELDTRMDEELAQQTERARAQIARLSEKIAELEARRTTLREQVLSKEALRVARRRELDGTYVEVLATDTFQALGIADDPLRHELWARAEDLMRTSATVGDLIGPNFSWHVVEQLALMVEEGYRRTILLDLRDGKRWMTAKPPEAEALWRAAGIPEPPRDDWATKKA